MIINKMLHLHMCVRGEDNVWDRYISQNLTIIFFIFIFIVINLCVEPVSCTDPYHWDVISIPEYVSAVAPVSLKCFPYLEASFQLFGTFYLYSFVVLCLLPIIMYILPETRDKGLNIINRQFINPCYEKENS